MIPPADSLLKYDNPVLVNGYSSNLNEYCKFRHSLSGPTTACHDWTCVTSTQTQDPLSRCQQTEEILNLYHCYRECMETNQLWVQQVSSTLCTRMDVVRQARETGICPVLRELYSRCFGQEREEGKMRCMDGSNIGKISDVTNQQLKVKAPSHHPCAVLPTPNGIVAPNKAGFS
uniref:Axonemal dynein light intermediate polypeptide 1 n=1 Tax=Oncorhynchus tshawytscha TaxID=74940 RepID=A0A8C8HCR8_ONCTS